MRIPRVATGNAPFAAGAKAPEQECDEPRRHKIAEAQAFLERALAGGRRPASEVLREATHAAMVSRGAVAVTPLGML